MKIVYSLSDIDVVVDKLLLLLETCQVITFTGDLGAGKTTLIRALLRRLGVVDTITSPTFTYVNAYKTAKGKMVYHFDVYRVKSVDSFVEAGFDEYLYASGSWSLVEWPQTIQPLLREKVCHCMINYYGEHQRVIEFLPEAPLV